MLLCNDTEGCSRTGIIQFFIMHPQHFQAADPKKATPAAPAAAAETVKAKEEPKTAAKTAEVVVDNKPAAVASQAGDDAANVPKKMEKRDSVQLFFKFLVRRASLFP